MHVTGGVREARGKRGVGDCRRVVELAVVLHENALVFGKRLPTRGPQRNCLHGLERRSSRRRGRGRSGGSDRRELKPFRSPENGTAIGLATTFARAFGHENAVVAAALELREEPVVEVVVLLSANNIGILPQQHLQEPFFHKRFGDNARHGWRRRRATQQ